MPYAYREAAQLCPCRAGQHVCRLLQGTLLLLLSMLGSIPGRLLLLLLLLLKASWWCRLAAAGVCLHGLTPALGCWRLLLRGLCSTPGGRRRRLLLLLLLLLGSCWQRLHGS